jgi:hypothetical protein
MSDKTWGKMKKPASRKLLLLIQNTGFYMVGGAASHWIDSLSLLTGKNTGYFTKY